MCWCAPTTQRWSLTSTTREVCVCVPCTSWHTRCLCGPQDRLAESRLHSWVSQYGSRHPVEAGAEARGMDALPRGGEADMESVWPGTGGPLCDSGDSAMSPLVLSDSSSPSGTGCHGADLLSQAGGTIVHPRPELWKLWVWPLRGHSS